MTPLVSVETISPLRAAASELAHMTGNDPYAPIGADGCQGLRRQSLVTVGAATTWLHISRGLQLLANLLKRITF